MLLDLDRLPADCLYAPEQDMWVRLQADGSAIIGTTHLAAAHGQFMLFTPRPVGTAVAYDRSLGVMETAKTAVAVHAPLSCVVLAANPQVERDVQWVLREPYGAGWLLRVQPSALAGELAQLLAVDAYRAWLAERPARWRAPADDLPTDGYDPARWASG